MGRVAYCTNFCFALTPFGSVGVVAFSNFIIYAGCEVPSVGAGGDICEIFAFLRTLMIPSKVGRFLLREVS